MEVDLTRFPLKIQLVNKIIQYNKHAILQLFICTTKAFCLRVNQTRKARDESKKKKTQVRKVDQYETYVHARNQIILCAVESI